ncbi:MAG: diaminopimelate epimerase [Candidatus Omnitrophica bacterium]|nr:diaminopimelate epimerase [Candidatus Omnitrophota bacterium]
MKEIPFVKLAGCGNDFILVDARSRSLKENPSKLAKAWCDRKRGIGADGLLLVLPSRKGTARMRIFNSDGSEASMCGNGLRCVVWYLNGRNGSHKQIAVETGAGTMKGQVLSPGTVRIFMTPPKELRLGLRLTYRGRRYQLHSVNTGVPHAVVLGRRISRMDLKTLGPFIRRHKLFGSAGTNVNLVEVYSPHRISVRTYERGVEDETLACGTGAVASVVIAAALGRLQSPVQVKTTGGETLTVGYQSGRRPWEGLYLEGPVDLLFQGGIRL